MAAPFPNEVSPSLIALAGDDESAAGHLMDLIYDELRGLAGRYFRDQNDVCTLQPTAVVHEAFVRVSERTGAIYNDRAHFFAVCAVTMRSILADYARRNRTAKRGGDRLRLDLVDVGTPLADGGIDALALDDALTELAARSERQARVVEYRFFSGMTEDEIGRVLGLSRSTVQEDWRSARAWLKVQLRGGTLS